MWKGQRSIIGIRKYFFIIAKFHLFCEHRNYVGKINVTGSHVRISVMVIVFILRTYNLRPIRSSRFECWLEYVISNRAATDLRIELLAPVSKWIHEISVYNLFQCKFIIFLIQLIELHSFGFTSIDGIFISFSTPGSHISLKALSDSSTYNGLERKSSFLLEQRHSCVFLCD